VPTKDGVMVAVVWLVVQAGPLIRELINAPDIELVSLRSSPRFHCTATYTSIQP
jgi:hypothetical protein